MPDLQQQRHTDITSGLPDHLQRINRGFEVNGLWYFELRGGGQKGPFDSEQEMLDELNTFIQLHENMDQNN